MSNKVSRQEFEALCGISQAYFTMNYKRGKIIMNDKDFTVDLDLDINKSFMDKRIEPTQKKNIKRAKAPSNKKSIETFDLDKKKKLLDIEEKETSIAINKIKLDKLNGVVIPTDLVMVIFGQHTKAITTSFHQAAENFVIEMAAAYSVSKKDIAKMRGELIEVVNNAVRESLEDSRKGIDNIIDELALNGK